MWHLNCLSNDSIQPKMRSMRLKSGLPRSSDSTLLYVVPKKDKKGLDFCPSRGQICFHCAFALLKNELLAPEVIIPVSRILIP